MRIKTLHLEEPMHQKTEQQIRMDEFFQTVQIKLNPENRWVKLSKLIPWWTLEERYACHFKNSRRGEHALSVRVALGALIIQTRLGLTDEEIVNQIEENKYLQYFLGIDLSEGERPFHPSMMTHFRKRLSEDILMEVNELIAMEGAKALEEKSKKKKNDSNDDDDFPQGPTGRKAEGAETPKQAKNKGYMLIDATCAPSDIQYPTDIRLLNEGREKLEKIIDILHSPERGKKKKPRTYRKKARKAYLQIEKKRKKGKKAIRKAIRKQLGFVERDLKIIDAYLSESPERIDLLSAKEQQNLDVIRTLYEQQQYMYTHRTHQVEDRIVSIAQPYLRPIIRGKAGADVEFGSKIVTTVVNGFSFIEHMSFSNFNEGQYLRCTVEKYKERFGYYPEAVMADTLFRNRENIQYLKKLGVRMSGPRLGRHPKDRQILKEQKKIEKLDAGKRNGVESSYGVTKRKYGLGLIKSKLEETSKAEIILQFLVMNLERRLQVLCAYFKMAICWILLKKKTEGFPKFC